MAELQKPVETAEDQEYRKQSLWHAFMAALYAGIGGASFFAVLNNVGGGLMKAAGAPAKQIADAGGVEAGGSFLNLAGLGGFTIPVMAGLAVIGAAALYMAQREYTELNILSTDRTARKQAECMGKQNGHEILSHEQKCVMEFEHNKRADGKKWQEVVALPHDHNVNRLH